MIAEALLGLIAQDSGLHETEFTNKARQLAALVLVFIRRKAAAQAIGANGQATAAVEAEALTTRLAAANEVFKITGRVATNARVVHTMAGTVFVGTHVLLRR